MEKLGLEPLPWASLAPCADPLLDWNVPTLSFSFSQVENVSLEGKSLLVFLTARVSFSNPPLLLFMPALSLCYGFFISSILNMSNCLVQITLLSRGLRDQSSFKLNLMSLPITSFLLCFWVVRSRTADAFLFIQWASYVLKLWCLLGWGDNIFSSCHLPFWCPFSTWRSPLNPQCKYGLCSYTPESPRLPIPEGEFLLRGLDRAQASGRSS